MVCGEGGRGGALEQSLTSHRRLIYLIWLMQEETLEIEYFESVMPPQRMSALPHEDWVASISCQLPGYVSYLLRLSSPR